MNGLLTTSFGTIDLYVGLENVNRSPELNPRWKNFGRSVQNDRDPTFIMAVPFKPFKEMLHVRNSIMNSNFCVQDHSCFKLPGFETWNICVSLYETFSNFKKWFKSVFEECQELFMFAESGFKTFALS